MGDLCHCTGSGAGAVTGPTDEDVIKYRQANCAHAFAKGIADRTPQCVHCGLKEHDYVPPLRYSP